MEDNELFENNNLVEVDAETIDDSDDEEIVGGSIAPMAITFGIGTLVGFAIDRFVAPAIGHAIDCAREGIVKLCTKDYTEVESKEDSKDSEN